jgi:two-component system chemotaxis response regulator CheB
MRGFQEGQEPVETRHAQDGGRELMSVAGSSSEPLRVFLADDASGVRQQLRLWEASSKDLFELRSFDTSHQLLRRVEYQEPDLVLLDLTPRGMDGLTVLRLLRDHVAPIVMLSPNTLDGARSTTEALLVGAADYLVKKRHRGEERVSITRTRFIHRLRNLLPQAVASMDERAGISGSDSRVDGQTWLEPDLDQTRRGWRGRPVADPFPETEGWIGFALATTRSVGLLIRALAEAPERPAGAMVIAVSQPPNFTRALRELSSRLWNRVVLELEDGERLRPGQWRTLPGREFLEPVPGEAAGCDWRLVANRVTDQREALRRQITLLGAARPGTLRFYLFDEPCPRTREVLRFLKARGDAVLIHSRALPVCDSGVKFERRSREALAAEPRLPFGDREVGLRRSGRGRA